MMRFLVLLALLAFVFVGCAEIELPPAKKILAPWSGTSPVQLGESKDSVRGKWGEPDEIELLGADEVGLIKEAWVYRGRYSDIPVDYKYLSKTKRLIFTGDSLTAYEGGEQE